MLIKPILRLIAKILSVIIYVLTLFSAFGGHVNPQLLTLPSMAVLMLPYLAILTLLIAVAWLCCGRIIIGAAGFVTLFVAWGPISSAVPVKFGKSPDNPDNSFTVLTYNILHGDDYRNPDSPGNRAFEFVINSGADIVCLQELVSFNDKEIRNFTPELEARLKEAYPYSAGTAACDLKILSKYPVKMIDTDIFINHDEIYRDRIWANVYKVKIKGRNLTVVNMHMNSYQLTEDEREVVTEIKSVDTAKQSIKEFKGSIWKKMAYSFKLRADNSRTLRKALDNLKNPVIVCGDFNDVPASYAYRILMGDDMHDAFADAHLGPTYTYNAHLFLFHLDQIFYRGDLKALSVKRESINSSDHYPLLATFEFTDDKEEK